MAWEVNTTIKEGIINLNKPMGMTSHDCVNMLRRLTGIKKIGHTGTLDPNATGVLPLCIGTSARINEYLDLDFKTYKCTMELGITTDTQDIWGEVESDCRQDLKLQKIAEADVIEAFAEFHGVISQYPPKYSAIRVNGRRLYQYARDGIDVEIKPRSVYIDSLTIDEINFSSQKLEVVFSVTCSKGTYIRSICRDVGDKLGCGGVMTALERTASGVFTIENSVTLEELQALRVGDDVRDPETGRYTGYGRADAGKLNKYILPADFPLVHFGKAVLDEERGRWFANGGHIAMKEAIIERKPEYHEKAFPIEMRDEFRHAYCMYTRTGNGADNGRAGGDSYIARADDGEVGGLSNKGDCAEPEGTDTFIGVAFYNFKYKKLVADKVFDRG